MDSSITAIIIIVVVIAFYAGNILPYATTSLLACLAMVLCGVIPFKDAFAGFASETMMMVAGVIVIGNALFETGAAKMLGEAITRFCGHKEKLFLAVCIIFTTILSAFASNTATVAMMLPIVASVAAKSQGLISKKNTYMAIGFASVGGGGLTLVGSTPQLIAQGILQDAGLRTIGFFEMANIALPRTVLLLLYFLTIGYSLQKRVFAFEEIQDNITQEQEKFAEIDRRKAYTSIAILLLCVIGFITTVLSIAMVSLLGAAACVITGCISEKRALQTMDWATLIILGGSLGFAAGLDKSGGGKLIAEFAIGIMGEDVSFFAVISMFSLLATVLGNIMSHTAAASVLIPIAVVMAKQLGFDATFLAIAVILGINISYTTPVATAPITMTLTGGYRFMDYVKVGGLLNLLSLGLTLLIYYLLLAIS